MRVNYLIITRKRSRNYDKNLVLTSWLSRYFELTISLFWVNFLVIKSELSCYYEIRFDKFEEISCYNELIISLLREKTSNLWINDLVIKKKDLVITKKINIKWYVKLFYMNSLSLFKYNGWRYFKKYIKLVKEISEGAKLIV